MSRGSGSWFVRRGSGPCGGPTAITAADRAKMEAGHSAKEGTSLEITFLGTSSGVPTRSRNVSSVALRLTQRGEIWLFDCGEGTQHQFLRSEFKASQIRRIFITHMHGDHIFGLMGLLASCGLAGNPQQKVDIYGPPKLHDYLQACRRYSQTHFSFPIKVHTVEPG